MTDDEPGPFDEPGDVVFGADPFKGAAATRPWLVLTNHEGRPFHGEQYFALTRTTKSWPDGLVEIPDAAWLRGGTPEKSRIVPWGVQSIDSEDMNVWQGRIDSSLLEGAIDALVDELSL